MNNPDDIKLHVAATLKRIRTEKNITQKELGDYLGVRNSTISAWESGQNSIDMAILIKMPPISPYHFYLIYKYDNMFIFCG